MSRTRTKFDVLFSSRNDEWETPQDLFDQLNAEFSFNTDVCADDGNHKCNHYYDKYQNGLEQTWHGAVWCNPPYGKEIGKWVRKAAESECTTVMLIPARTDTRWFHEHIYHNPRCEVRFIKGRLKFVGAPSSAPFPSMIVVFNGRKSIL